jgi:hypothetical protein
MTNSPRDLDPKFRNAEPTDTNLDDAKDSAPEESEVSMTVHIERYMDGSVQRERRHGPMPSSEWPAYEKKHGF